MTMADRPVLLDMLGMTANIVSAHASNNAVAAADLAGLIHDVYRSLAAVGRGKQEEERPVPAVPVRKSVFADHIVCLEDGKKLKMLKRHLMAAYGLSPDQYRQRWELPPDYPMVAPDYARRRSALAKKIGLGTKPRAG